MDDKTMVEPNDAIPARERLSALADGEASLNEVGLACQAWRDDPAARANWHAYALIGDVLRSEDLAGSSDRDMAFLTRLRCRLELEPVVLAPMTVADQYAGRREETLVGGRRGALRVANGRWSVPLAIAAGVLTVAGGVGYMGGGFGRSGDGALAVSRGVPAQGRVLASNANASAVSAKDMATVSAVSAPEGVQIMRNPVIDRYLNAHRQYSQGSLLVAPGGLRQVATTPTER